MDLLLMHLYCFNTNHVPQIEDFFQPKLAIFLLGKKRFLLHNGENLLYMLQMFLPSPVVDQKIMKENQ
jgi:hypothetical protein